MNRWPPSLLTGSFAPTRTHRCRHAPSVPGRNRSQVLRPKPVKPATDGFEAQTTKPATDGFEAQTTKPFDACHHGPRSPEQPGRPSSPLDLRARHLVPVDTVTPCVLAPVDVPSVSHYGLPPGDLVRQSKPHVRPSPLPVHQHGTSSLAFTSPSASGSAARHLHNTNQETRRFDTPQCASEHSRSNCTK